MKDVSMKNVTTAEKTAFFAIFTQEFQEFNFENLLISENTKLKGRFIDILPNKEV